MDFLYVLQDYLAEETDLVSGQTLFAHTAPANAPRCVLLLLDRYNSSADEDLIGSFYLPYQVIIRDPSLDVATERAWEIVSLLRREEPLLFDGGAMVRSALSQPPIPYRPSSGDIIEISVNFTSVFHVY